MKTIEELRRAANSISRGMFDGHDLEAIDEAINELERRRSDSAVNHDVDCPNFSKAVDLAGHANKLDAKIAALKTLLLRWSESTTFDMGLRNDTRNCLAKIP